MLAVGPSRLQSNNTAWLDFTLHSRAQQDLPCRSSAPTSQGGRLHSDLPRRDLLLVLRLARRWGAACRHAPSHLSKASWVVAPCVALREARIAVLLTHVANMGLAVRATTLLASTLIVPSLADRLVVVSMHDVWMHCPLLLRWAILRRACIAQVGLHRCNGCSHCGCHCP